MVDVSENIWELLPWHSHQKMQLISQLNAGKVPHAYLFSGLEGLGKKNVANFLAAYLLCEQASARDEPCRQCKQCKLMEGGIKMEIIFQFLDLPKNSKVLVPAHTMLATASAVKSANLIPIPVDVDPDSLLLEIKQLEKIFKE